ncbi:MAG: DNA internalization-related competence protein ComEC/Rec2 [Proteobacteria bacterium]|nr:DNA internalization-related competence protein ComEC/Rec2 [Pseudomonadota bacterium]
MITRPLLPVFITYSLGILTGYFLEIPSFHPLYLFLLSALALGLAVLNWRSPTPLPAHRASRPEGRGLQPGGRGGPRLALVCFACLFLVLGAETSRGRLTPSAGDRFLSARAQEEGKLILDGWISGLPENYPDHVRLPFQSRFLAEGDRLFPVASRLLLNVPAPAPAFRVGDRVRLKTTLHPPRGFGNPGSFDSGRYLARQGVFLVGNIAGADEIVCREGRGGNPWLNRVQDLRRRMADFMDAGGYGESGEILKALVVGVRAGLPDDLWKDFSRTGTIHLLSISGLHFAIVAAIFFFLVRFLLSRSSYLLLRFNLFQVSAWISIPPVIFYVLVAGANIPTLRSAIMILVYQAAVILGRERDVYSALLLAAFLLVVIFPLSLLEVSFALSFGSVLAILYLTPRLAEYFQADPDLLYLLEPSRLRQFGGRVGTLALVSLAAALGTFPLVARYFNMVSLVSVPANLVLVPWLSFLSLPLGLLGGFLHFLFPETARFILDVAAWITGLSLGVVRFFSHLPGAWFRVTTPTLLEVGLLYLAVLAGANLKRSRWPKLVLPAALALLVLDQAYWMIKPQFQRDLRVTILDVGQGDAILVELPFGKRVLLDGGGFEESDFDPGEKILAPFLWEKKIRRLDYVINSHPHFDHFGGLRFILREFSVGEVWKNPQDSYYREYREFLGIIRERKLPLRIVDDAAPDLEIGGVRFEFLSPPAPGSEEALALGGDQNENSLVLRLNFGETNILLASDLMARAEARLAAKNYPLSADVLKVPHHGGKASSTPVFLAAVRPRSAVITTGPEDGIRSVSREVLERYQAVGARVYRTDRTGAVTIRSNGRRVTVETFR